MQIRSTTPFPVDRGDVPAPNSGGVQPPALPPRRNPGGPVPLQGHEMPMAARRSAAPRNALPPPSLQQAAQLSLGIAAQLGGPLGQGAAIASVALAGASGASNLKQAALGAAIGLGRAFAPKASIAGALKLASLGQALVKGQIEPKNAMVQGLGAALDIAVPFLPLPYAKAAQMTSGALAGMVGAQTPADAMLGAAMGAAASFSPHAFWLAQQATRRE